MQTAKQFMSNIGVCTSPISGLETYLKDDFEIALIEFAKLHVEAALKAAVDNVEIVVIKYTDDEIVSDESILNAYPLTLIK